MRRITILCIALVMSALAFNNCAYPDWEPVPSVGESVGGATSPELPKITDFSLVASLAQTKSALTEDGILVWEEGDLVNVFHGVSGEADLISDGVVYYNSRSETPNEFKGKLGEELKNGFIYDWYVFYPYTENFAILDNKAGVTIGSTAAGTQKQDGYSNRSHVSGNGMPMYGTAMGVDENKTPVAELQHIASIVELNITSCMPQPVEITEVKVSAGEAISGSFVIDLVKGTFEPVEGSSTNTATLEVRNATAIENGQSAKFYLVVKPFVAKAADGLTITVNGAEKKVYLNSDLAFVPGKTTSIDYTYYDVSLIEDSLIGCYKIESYWVYGGTGPGYGGAGWIDLHNKPWWFDQTSGHGIQADLDNYVEFTLTDLLDGGNKATGKCINWAGVDGMNWSCFFHNSSINGGLPEDGRKFYRQIPVGESTWVRDYTVTPNTVTFTDSYGTVTVVELHEPEYSFVPGYGDSNAAGNTRVFPLTDGSDLTFHAKVKGVDKWGDIIYTEIDKVYWNPRDIFIDVTKVDEIPAEAKTYEPPYEPGNPYPESIAGTYKYNSDKTVGGKDGAITVKGLIEQYGSWDPVKASINSMKNDVYTFTATGTDDKQNEVGTVSFDDGGDGTWDYQLLDNMNGNKAYDGTDLYGIIAHDNTTTYVYDRAGKTITFTTRGKQYVVDYLLPGEYTYSTAKVPVPASATFGMHYDMGYTEARVEGYATTSNGFSRHYVWARDWVLCLEKQ